jgi:hypothetical protein
MPHAWDFHSFDSLDGHFFLFSILFHFFVMLGLRLGLCLSLWACVHWRLALEGWFGNSMASRSLFYIDFIGLSLADKRFPVVHSNNWLGWRSQTCLRGVVNDTNAERLGSFFKGAGWFMDWLEWFGRGIKERFVREGISGVGIFRGIFFLGFYRRFLKESQYQDEPRRQKTKRGATDWKQRGESGRPVVAPLKSGEREVPSFCEAAHHKRSPLPQSCRYQVY